MDADVIVVGNKGMQGVRRILGSVPNSVAHQAPCDVLIAFTTRSDLPLQEASHLGRMVSGKLTFADGLETRGEHVQKCGG